MRNSFDAPSAPLALSCILASAYCSCLLFASTVTGYLSEGGYAAVVAASFEKPMKEAMYVLFAMSDSCVWRMQRVVWLVESRVPV